jgi:hypothetical protein
MDTTSPDRSPETAEIIPFPKRAPSVPIIGVVSWGGRVDLTPAGRDWLEKAPDPAPEG